MKLRAQRGNLPVVRFRRHASAHVENRPAYFETHLPPGAICFHSSLG